MAFTTEEVKANLTELAARWMVREGYEKGEAQTFLNELCAFRRFELWEPGRFPGAPRLVVDLRYTPTSCFETFPWPEPSDAQRDSIGELSRSLLGIRGAICTKEQIGLTTLYNQMDDGAWQDLARAHRELDGAVAKACGWPAKVA